MRPGKGLRGRPHVRFLGISVHTFSYFRFDLPPSQSCKQIFLCAITSPLTELQKPHKSCKFSM